MLCEICDHPSRIFMQNLCLPEFLCKLSDPQEITRTPSRSFRTVPKIRCSMYSTSPFQSNANTAHNYTQTTATNVPTAPFRLDDCHTNPTTK